MTEKRTVLVIKLGALGDFVQALGPFASIRHHHPANRIVLLTTSPFVPIAEASDCFDEIHNDGRPEWWQFGKTRALRNWMRSLDPVRVYDLQTSGRSNRYFKLFRNPRPEWSGIAAGCSHPHANPARDYMHTIERQAEQLSAAGIGKIPTPNLDWLDTNTSSLPVPDRFILMAPGGAAHRPDKRWPYFADLARSLIGQDLTPVLLGTEAERDVIDTISAACPGAVDLTGRTNLMEIAGLARRAAGAVGNDTGPMHLIAATGCPSLVLYSSASDPALCAQRGPTVRILRKPNLADVGVEEVEAQLTLR
ncbi:MAG: glycosyltransferase family 9 protein [Rhodospirillaceae bacterium]|nr:glycosyltransferase family 9 protein [Rhodospirillaceae bacterium]